MIYLRWLDGDERLRVMSAAWSTDLTVDIVDLGPVDEEYAARVLSRYAGGGAA